MRISIECPNVQDAMDILAYVIEHVPTVTTFDVIRDMAGEEVPAPPALPILTHTPLPTQDNEEKTDENLSTADRWLARANEAITWKDVRTLRLDMGVAQGKFAQLYGCKQPTLCNNEIGGRMMQEATKQKVIETVQKYIDFLAGDESLAA